MNSQIDAQTREHSEAVPPQTAPTQPHGSSAIDRRFSSGNRASRPQPSAGRSAWGLRVSKWLFAGAILVLFLGLLLYSWMVVPLEKKLAAREIHSLAERIDSEIKMRTEVVRAATSGMKVANLNASGSLDRAGRILRKAFPDFLSLEIVNEEGDLLAMVGDIALPGNARTSPADSEGSVEQKSTPASTFRDDPKERSFIVESRLESAGGTPWATRARFSRDTIERLLNASRIPLPATLVEVPVNGTVIAGIDGNNANMGTNWLGGLTWIEAPLSAPGWWIRMESVPRQSAASRLPLKTVALFLLVLTLAVLLFRWNSISKRTPPAKASASCLTADHDTFGKTVRNAGTFRGGDSSTHKPADTYEDLGSTRGDHDDFFAGEATNEFLRSKEKPGERKQPYEPVSDGHALEGVFASPGFIEEFSEGSPPAVNDTAIPAKDSKEAVSPNAFESVEILGPDTEPANASEEPGLHRIDETLSRDAKLPEVLDLVWTEPTDTVEPERGSLNNRTGNHDAPACNAPATEAMPECLEVRWIEPAKDDLPAPASSRSAGRHGAV